MDIKTSKRVRIVFCLCSGIKAFHLQTISCICLDFSVCWPWVKTTTSLSFHNQFVGDAVLLQVHRNVFEISLPPPFSDNANIYTSCGDFPTSLESTRTLCWYVRVLYIRYVQYNVGTHNMQSAVNSRPYRQLWQADPRVRDRMQRRQEEGDDRAEGEHGPKPTLVLQWVKIAGVVCLYW